MTEREALEEIRICTEAGTCPTLSGDELRLLLRKAKRADSRNRPPSDAAWEPTWNLPYAIAMGWRLKAGKVAGAYDMSSGPTRMSRSQFRAHCLSQAKEWSKRASEAVTLPGTWRRATILGETNGILEEDLEDLV